MNGENFIVRERQQAVDRFRKRKAWNELSEEDYEVLTEQVAGLPSEIETDDIQSRMFDLTALRMQLAQVQGEDTLFETARRKVVEIAAMLKEKTAIPAVKAQLAYLAAPAGDQLLGGHSWRWSSTSSPPGGSWRPPRCTKRRSAICTRVARTRCSPGMRTSSMGSLST